MKQLKKLLPFIVAIIVIGYLLLVDSPSSRLFDTPTDTKIQLAPAFFITDFVSTQRDADGNIQQLLKGDKANHYQPKQRTSNDDYTEIFALDAEIHSPDSLPWFITADQGIATQQGTKIELSGDVHLWQIDPINGRTELFTEKLTYFTKHQFAETDQAVKILSPSGETTAVGLSADLRKQKFTLLKEVRGLHVPL